MEYADGKFIEDMVDVKVRQNVEEIKVALAWIVKALRDCEVMPNEEKPAKTAKEKQEK